MKHQQTPHLAQRPRNPGAANGQQPFFAGQHVQPKLRVNTPGDRFEKEADAVADRVMRMPSLQNCGHPLQAGGHALPTGAPMLQRKCKKCEDEKKKMLQRKEIAGDRMVSPQTADLLSAERGRGRPLPPETRSWMESRIGADFSGVRIHADRNAAKLSRSLHAHAFTHGGDIYFNEGKYAPATTEGKRLLAHELTHVVQQGHAATPSGTIQRAAPAAAAAPVTVGAVLAWCLSGAAVSVVIDEIFQAVRWWSSGEVKQNWCRTLFNALFGCVFGMAAGAIRTTIFSAAASFTIAELSLWIKQRLVAAGYTWLAGKWGVTIALLGCDESQERLNPHE